MTTQRTVTRRILISGATAAAGAAAVSSVIKPVNIIRAQEPVTITFWQFSLREAAIAAYEAAIEAFEAENPDVKVNMEIVPWADQHQKLVTALTSGGLPDVSMLGNNVVAEFHALDALLPMTEYFNAWSEEAGRDITEDIWPGDHLYYFLDDEWWGSPVAEETRCLYYRRDLLEAAGLTEEDLGTWEGLRDAAVAINSDDVYGIALPGGIVYETLQTFMSTYLGYGARFLNEEGLCGFDSQEFRDALSLYTGLYTEQQVCPPDTPTATRDALAQLFTDGRAGMFIDGPWFWQDFEAAGPDFLDSVGIAEIPAGPAGQFGFLGGWPLVMWKDTEHPDEAFRWIKFATDPDGYLGELAASTGNLPGKRSIVDQAPWNEPPLDVFARQMEFAYPYQYPDPEIPQMGTLEVDAVQTAVQSVMLEQATVDEATIALVERINEVLTR